MKRGERGVVGDVVVVGERSDSGGCLFRMCLFIAVLLFSVLSQWSHLNTIGSEGLDWGGRRGGGGGESVGG